MTKMKRRDRKETKRFAPLRSGIGGMLLLCAVLVGLGLGTMATKTVTAAEETTVVENGFATQGSRLIQYSGTDEIVTIPSTVTSIAGGAFYENTTVKKIVVPASVTHIESFAFYKCDNLRYIVFAGNAQYVAENIIYECSNMTSAVAPKNSLEYRCVAQSMQIPVFDTDRPTLIPSVMNCFRGDRQILQIYNTLDAAKWSSSKKKIATVTADGIVTCRKEGTAKIIATCGANTYTMKIVVEKNTEPRRVAKVVKMARKSGKSKKKRIKAVHDWLVKNVKYDYQNFLKGTVPYSSHTSEGALVKGVAVCDGYTKAFQKIMEDLKIPCRIVTGQADGSGHAWNQVKLNNRWLHVDVTFDDPIVSGKNTNTKPRYTYYLKTDSQMRKDHSW